MALGLEITELRLGLPGGGGEGGGGETNNKKRVFSEIDHRAGGSNSGGGGDNDDDENSCSGDRKMAPPAKNQVVGWPPVCSYRRRNSMSEASTKMYVKVSMDGAPFLRKVDLAMQKGYSHLAFTLENLFDCHGIGEFNFSYIPFVFTFFLLIWKILL